jgi:hypothetical protein
MTLVHTRLFERLKVKLSKHLKNFFSVPYRDLLGVATEREIQLSPIIRSRFFEDEVPWHSLYAEQHLDFKQFSEVWTGDPDLAALGTLQLIVSADQGQITMLGLLTCQKNENGNGENVTSISLPILMFDLEVCLPEADCRNVL